MMKNPFKIFRRQEPPTEEKAPTAVPAAEPAAIAADAPDTGSPPPAAQADDSFTEWCRSRTHGGIERRERNDIYEAYNVYGTDDAGQLICRRYHRYPEHERDFGLSYSRALRFDEFNRRLLGELDRGHIGLDDYHACITRAKRLETPDAPIDPEPYRGFDAHEEAALRAFCDAADTLVNKSYLHEEGILRCECESVVGAERLNLRFRRPLPHDALYTDVPGVKKEAREGYDIDDLWIMSVYNRLRERCRACRAALLTYEWSTEHEALWLFTAEEPAGIGGTVLIAVGSEESFRRFAFWSLDFSKK